jgi:hypothetical protein
VLGRLQLFKVLEDRASVRLLTPVTITFAAGEGEEPEPSCFSTPFSMWSLLGPWLG